MTGILEGVLQSKLFLILGRLCHSRDSRWINRDISDRRGLSFGGAGERRIFKDA